MWARGIDVSKFQGAIDWDAVVDAGATFCWIREGESNWSTPDDRWAQNWHDARAAGLLCGPYHAIHGGVDPRVQARILRDRCGDFRPGVDLPPALDWEVAGGGHEPEEALAFIEEAEALFGVRLVVYTGMGFADRWPELRETALASRPLWVAHYGVSSPTAPRAWGTSGGGRSWAFWQMTGNGRWPGISTPVDLDVYAGTVDGLRYFCSQAFLGTATGTAPTEPAPPPTMRSAEMPRAESPDPAPLTTAAQASTPGDYSEVT